MKTVMQLLASFKNNSYSEQICLHKVNFTKLSPELYENLIQELQKIRSTDSSIKSLNFKQCKFNYDQALEIILTSGAELITFINCKINKAQPVHNLRHQTRFRILKILETPGVTKEFLDCILNHSHQTQIENIVLTYMEEDFKTQIITLSQKYKITCTLLCADSVIEEKFKLKYLPKKFDHVPHVLNNSDKRQRRVATIETAENEHITSQDFNHNNARRNRHTNHNMFSLKVELLSDSSSLLSTESSQASPKVPILTTSQDNEPTNLNALKLLTPSFANK